MMAQVKYPAWIDEYARSVHQAFSHMLPCSWGPVDMIALMSYLNGSLVAKVYEAVRRLEEQGVSADKAARTFSNLSALRFTFWYLLSDYVGAEEKPREQMRLVLDYLVAGLQSWAQEDVFALKKNIGHSPGEIEAVVNELTWLAGDPQTARELGKLYNSLAAMGFALYRDYFPQEAHEIYGPYDVSKRFGDGAILIMKHFAKIKPVELWPQAKDWQYEEVKIYQVFRNVKFRCEFIGMHSIYEGDLMNGLEQYAAMANGQAVRGLDGIKQLNSYFEQLATEQSQIYDDMSHEELISKSLEWLCYQYINMFKLAGMDWRPTQEMKAAIAGKQIGDRYKAEAFPAYDEFVASREYEVYWLRDIYS